MERNNLSKIYGYYAASRSEAETAAAENLYRARFNPDFKKADDALASIERDLAFAEIANDGRKVKELEAQKKSLTVKRAGLLKNLGMKESDIIPDYKCKICNDTGNVNGKKCVCFDNVADLFKLKGLGISIEKLPEFTSFTPLNEEQKKISDKLKVYADKFPDVKTKNLILTGKTGTGKTYLAGCIASAAAEKGQNAIVITAFALNNVFLSYHSLFDKNRYDDMNELIDCDLLIIDDLGAAQNIKNVTANYLLNLINERNLNGTATVVTTNLTPDEILSTYGERVFSRLFDKRLTAVIPFNGEDLRLKKIK